VVRMTRRIAFTRPRSVYEAAQSCQRRRVPRPGLLPWWPGAALRPLRLDSSCSRQPVPRRKGLYARPANAASPVEPPSSSLRSQRSGLKVAPGPLARQASKTCIIATACSSQPTKSCRASCKRRPALTTESASCTSFGTVLFAWRAILTAQKLWCSLPVGQVRKAVAHPGAAGVGFRPPRMEPRRGRHNTAFPRHCRPQGTVLRLTNVIHYANIPWAVVRPGGRLRMHCARQSQAHTPQQFPPRVVPPEAPLRCGFASLKTPLTRTSTRDGQTSRIMSKLLKINNGVPFYSTQISTRLQSLAFLLSLTSGVWS
jgi:hypothetical protein